MWARLAPFTRNTPLRARPPSLPSPFAALLAAAPGARTHPAQTRRRHRQAPEVHRPILYAAWPLRDQEGRAGQTFDASSTTPLLPPTPNSEKPGWRRARASPAIKQQQKKPITTSSSRRNPTMARNPICGSLKNQLIVPSTNLSLQRIQSFGVSSQGGAGTRQPLPPPIPSSPPRGHVMQADVSMLLH